MPNYRALVGMNYPPDRRVEAGDVVSDIPAKSLKWLREQGLIELVEAPDAVVQDDVSDTEAELPADSASEDEGDAA